MSSVTAWAQMIARCYDPEHPKYPGYGGRGIRVCDRWICRRLFVEDMGSRPDGKTLNRIDNDMGYSPENCEWATPLEQAQNTRANKNLTHNGETKCLSEWERTTGIYRKTIAQRIKNGWTVEQALTTPVSKKQAPKDMRHDERFVR
jgi:hypothetical protein